MCHASGIYWCSTTYAAHAVEGEYFYLPGSLNLVQSQEDAPASKSPFLAVPRAEQICSGLLLSLWLQPASPGALFVPLALRVRGRSKAAALGLARAQAGWGLNLRLGCEAGDKANEAG